MRVEELRQRLLEETGFDGEGMKVEVVPLDNMTVLSLTEPIAPKISPKWETTTVFTIACVTNDGSLRGLFCEGAYPVTIIVRQSSDGGPEILTFPHLADYGEIFGDGQRMHMTWLEELESMGTGRQPEFFSGCPHGSPTVDTPRMARATLLAGAALVDSGALSDQFLSTAHEEVLRIEEQLAAEL